MAKQSTTATTTDHRPARSDAQWDTLARTVIVPLLQQGVTMTEVRLGGPSVAKAGYPNGFGTGATIRRALMRIGYNTKGQEARVATVKASSKKVLARRVAERREAGASWDRLELETGMGKDALVALLTQFQYEALAEGRVLLSRRAKAARAKAQAEAAAKAAKPKRARRARKAQPQPEPQPVEEPQVQAEEAAPTEEVAL